LTGLGGDTVPETFSCAGFVKTIGLERYEVLASEKYCDLNLTGIKAG